jgi:hypothetical protein
MSDQREALAKAIKLVALADSSQNDKQQFAIDDLHDLFQDYGLMRAAVIALTQPQAQQAQLTIDSSKATYENLPLMHIAKQQAAAVSAGQPVWLLVREDDESDCVMFYTEKPSDTNFKDRFNLKEYTLVPRDAAPPPPVLPTNPISKPGNILGIRSAALRKLIESGRYDAIVDDHEDGDSGHVVMVRFVDALFVEAEKAAPVLPLSAWQPIETAPKDGTKFLGYRRGEVATSFYVPRDDCEMWSFGNESGAFEHWPRVRPTHWKPLPAPPITEPGAGGEG